MNIDYYLNLLENGKIIPEQNVY